ncbi:HNH endonuclease [Parabacteroides sp.]
MTYEEQLKTKEWKEKRNKILRRDNYHCQHCGKFGICGDDIHISLHRLEEMKDYIIDQQIVNIIKTYLFKDDYKDENKESFEVWDNNDKYPIKKISDWLLCPVITENSIDLPYYIICKRPNDIKSISVYYTEMFTFSIEMLVCDNLKNSNALISFQVTRNNSKDIYQISYDNKSIIIRNSKLSLPLLNIHHKSYIVNHDAWEYENSNLITLCEDCHQKEHEQHEILEYDENNKPIKKMKTCSRCKGIGYIKQYKHYQNGVCFDCHGLGVI